MGVVCGGGGGNGVDGERLARGRGGGGRGRSRVEAGGCSGGGGGQAGGFGDAVNDEGYAFGAAMDDGRGALDQALRVGEAAAAVLPQAPNAIEVDVPARGLPVGWDVPWFFTRAFPHPFPSGHGDFCNPHRNRQGGITLRAWAKNIMLSKHTRFRRDPHFVAILNNIITRDTAMRVGDNINFVARAAYTGGEDGGQGDAAGAGAGGEGAAPRPKLTVEALRSLAADPHSGLRGLLASQLATASGSAQFWKRVRHKLEALIEQKGKAPTVFATFSAADTYWKDLQRLLGLPPDSTPEQRQKAVARDPAVCVTFFRERLASLFKHLYGDKLEDYFIRFEFQERGSVHAHCLLWLRGVPDLTLLLTSCDEAAALPPAPPHAAGEDPPPRPTYRPDGIRNTPIISYRDPPSDTIPASTGVPTPAEHLRMLCLGDYYLTSHRYYNDLTPPQLALYKQYVENPNMRPSSTEFADALHAAGSDLERQDMVIAQIAALFDTVQRHTQCGPGCIRGKKCRYLDRVTSDYSIHSDTVHYPTGTGTSASYSVGTARNDHRINRVNLQTAATWRANPDVQLVPEPKALNTFTTQYV